MPFMTVETWSGISPDIKKKWIYEATRITVEFLNIPPDKIQVIIRELSKENWGKAGVVPTDHDFAETSRVVNWVTQDSYYDGESLVSNMVVITIDLWDIYDQNQKDKLTKLLTDLTASLLNASPDNILILFHDLPPGNWSQSGVTGANSEFLNLSRCHNFEG